MDTELLRSDAWGASLTEAQRWTVYDRHRRGEPWQKTVEWAVAEYGCRPGGRTAFYRFLRAMRKGEWAHRIEEAVQAGKDVTQLAGRVGASRDCAEALKSLILSEVMSTGSADSVRGLLKVFEGLAADARRADEIRLREKALAQAEEGTRLAREKFEAAEKREAAARGLLENDRVTPEEREKRLRELFHLS